MFVGLFYGFICMELKLKKVCSFGFIFGLFCQVGGINRCMVWMIFILFVSSSFSMLFIELELELVLLMNGVVLCRLGISGVWNL